MRKETAMRKTSEQEIKKLMTEQEIPESISPENIKKMLDEKSINGNSRKNRSRIIKMTASIATAAAVLAGVIGFSVYNNINNKHNVNDMILSGDIKGVRYAKSYKDIYDDLDLDTLKNNDPVTGEYSIIEDAEESGELKSEESAVMADGAEDNGAENDAFADIAADGNTIQNVNGNNGEKNYSEALDQENGVKEADIVKTDGNTIYISMPYKDNGVKAVKANNGHFEDIQTFAEDTGTIHELYLYNDKVIVMSDITGDTGNYYAEDTLITVYSKDTLEKLGAYKQSGYFNDVRLRDDGVLYLVTNDPAYYLFSDDTNADEPESYIPSYCVNDKKELVDYSDIIIQKNKYRSNDRGYINISVLDMDSSSPCQPTDMRSIAGLVDNIYCSYDSLYLTSGYDQTMITKLTLQGKNIIPTAGTTIKGTVLDQFSMSEFDGYFRISTTFDLIDILSGYTDSTNNILYILDENLSTVGSVSNFGRGEQIKSVNFQGNTAYVVTYEQTDPLFSIDLSDPTNPVIMDELKVTGYSGYMQKWKDGQLLGFGEAGNENGSRTGIKVSMFDNSNPNDLKELDKIEWLDEYEMTDGADGYAITENTTYYTMFYDRKSFLIYPEKNLIGVPIEKSIYAEDFREESEYQFFTFENGRFKKVGNVVSSQNDPYFNNRCVVIGDYAYCIFNSELVAADINNGFAVTENIVFEIERENDTIVY